MATRKLCRWLTVCVALAATWNVVPSAAGAILWVNNDYQQDRVGPLGCETNPYDTIDAAYGDAINGDTLRIVATGLPYAQNTVEIAKQLTLEGYNGRPRIQNTGNSYTLDVYAQNVTLDSLEIDGNGTNSSHVRVAKWADADNFTLKNCRLHAGDYNAVDLRGIDYPLSNVLIENNTIENFLGNADSHGIVTDGSLTNITIRYNDINDCSGDCIQFTPYSQVGWASGLQVYGNTLYRTHNDNTWYTSQSVQVPENAIDIKEAYDLTIDDNVMYSFRGTNTSSPAAILLRIRTDAQAGSIIDIVNNIFYDNENAITVDTVEGGSVTCQDVRIARNLIYDIVDTGGDVRKGRGISLGEAIDVTLAHNTLDGGIRSSLYFLPDTGKNITNFLCYNNLFANSSRVVERGNDIIGTVTITHNGYFNCNADPWTSEGESESNATTGGDGTNIFADKANADYSLVDLTDPAVDAIDKGSTAYGEPYVGAAPDLGAYELDPNGNQPPQVNAGVDDHITLPTDTVSLDGTVTDDGLPDPPGTFTTLWTQDSGPGTVMFGNDTAIDTTATFSQAGVYVLKLEADDSELTGSDTVTVTVDPEPTVEFDLIASSDSESVMTVHLSVSLSGASQNTVTVDYAVTGGTAVSPDDYTIAGTQLTFDPGVTQQDIVITVVDDGEEESDETVEVTLSNPSNATLGANTVHTYTIVDNEGPGQDFANADIPVTGDVSGSYLDTQASDDVYESITEVRVGNPAKGFSALEHVWTIDVTGGLAVTFYVEAHKTVSSDGDDFVFAYSEDDDTYIDMVTVTKTADDDTAQSYVLPSSLVGTVYIRVTDTDHTQGNQAMDTIYVDQMYIESADEPGEPTVQFDLTSSNASESVASVNLAVSLSNSSDQTVTVDYAVTGGTADDPNDYTMAGTQLSFSPGVTTQYVPITVVEDVEDELDETIEVTLSSPTGATLGANTVHTYTIVDNDGVSPPGQASNPSPTDGATKVAISGTTLSWTAGSGGDSHDVYFGTNPTPGASEFQGNQTDTTFEPGDLVKLTMYYWRIDEVNDGGTTTGVVWSFKASNK